MRNARDIVMESALVGFCVGVAYAFLFAVYPRGNHPAALLTGGAFALAAVVIFVEAVVKMVRTKRADEEKRDEDSEHDV